VRDNNGDGIAVLDSSDTQIYGNTVITNAADPGADPPSLPGRPLERWVSHQESLRSRQRCDDVWWFDWGQGLGRRWRYLRTAAEHRFESNTYAVPDPAGKWTWRGEDRTWQDWQQVFGQDTMGSVTTASC
jgi:hypothetical protein